MKRFPLILIVAGLALVAVAVVGARAAAPAPQLVFVLAGQSNMVGRGQPLSLASPPNPRLLEWRGDGGWQVAHDPLGPVSDGAIGIGPGMTFGLQIAKHRPGSYVGLVMCAAGGTSIAEWQPTGDLYRNCVAQVQASGAKVAGVLFLQGEADARETLAQAQAWPAAFENVYSAWRHDFAGAPVLLGQIGSIDPAKYTWQATIRAEQKREAAKLGLPLVRTLDLPVGVDGGHFTVPAYRVVGARFATAWLRAQR